MRVTQLKNDLLATVSHELKTPLASMRLLVETLLDGRYEDPRRVREYLELISKENDRLSRLVENFLSFSRMEPQQTPLRPHPGRTQPRLLDRRQPLWGNEPQPKVVSST